MNANQNMSTFFIFFPWKYCMLQFYKATVEWNIADDIAYSISLPLFLWLSKLTYVLSKMFWHFSSNPTWCKYFHFAESGLNPLRSHLACHHACMVFVVRLLPGMAALLLWRSIGGDQHNTRLNMFEHIPSNPEHTVIIGVWASNHVDHTNSYQWSAEVCKGVWPWEGWRIERRRRKWRLQQARRIEGHFLRSRKKIWKNR